MSIQLALDFDVRSRRAHALVAALREWGLPESEIMWLATVYEDESAVIAERERHVLRSSVTLGDVRMRVEKSPFFSGQSPPLSTLCYARATLVRRGFALVRPSGRSAATLVCYDHVRDWLDFQAAAAERDLTTLSNSLQHLSTPFSADPDPEKDLNEQISGSGSAGGENFVRRAGSCLPREESTLKNFDKLRAWLVWQFEHENCVLTLSDDDWRFCVAAAIKARRLATKSPCGLFGKIVRERQEVGEDFLREADKALAHASFQAAYTGR